MRNRCTGSRRQADIKGGYRRLTGAAPVSWNQMITDLVQIRVLGEKKRDENLRFRRHMKSHDHSDRILRRIAEKIEEQIDCLECGNCCKVATAVLSERDVER